MSTPHTAPLDHKCHFKLASLGGTRLADKNLTPTYIQHSGLDLTAQLHDLLLLKQENAYLTTITKQITPYIRSIARVKERLEPR